MLHYMSISGLFIHSSVNDIRVLSSFQAIVNNARYKCFCGCVFLSVGRCLSMGWLGCMVTQCDPVSICQPVFQGGYTNPCFSTDPLICSMVPAILVGERCCLLVVLVCISWWHWASFHVALVTSSLEKPSSGSLPIFKLVICGVLLMNCKSLKNTFQIVEPYPHMWFMDVFSHSVSSFFLNGEKF